MKDLDELQAHECAQQELLEKIQQEVHVFAESYGRQKAAVGLILAVLAYLAGRGTEKEEGQVVAFDFIDALRFFAAKVRKPVEDFTKDETERSLLLARFFEWLAKSFAAPFKAEFLRSLINAETT